MPFTMISRKLSDIVVHDIRKDVHFNDEQWVAYELGKYFPKDMVETFNYREDQPVFVRELPQGLFRDNLIVAIAYSREQHLDVWMRRDHKANTFMPVWFIPSKARERWEFDEAFLHIRRDDTLVMRKPRSVFKPRDLQELVRQYHAQK
jgi:hypothetical protein